ncbi:ATP-dependent DNA ligase [Muricauda oceani]|uniref:DNA ligase (ATP) n=1 Tax=Flagellimonas oceani TaxID=2698672 RepID=A0A6G7J8C0_9FLAO|nr:ATP-dependent DNA ligase [Allomuricauda oceani]MBW8242965.1 ATP-dependent DNA ligase [Allomuricauda oceani]QII46677.1 ATP-dependent DNA ligase [Allomuricauda oceani]
MKQFAQLIKTLDGTNKTNVKVEALSQYFKEASDQDKVWTIAILSHRRPPRPVNTTLLRTWAAELSHIPLWLFEESYHIVGDLAETIALVVPSTEKGSKKSLTTFLQEMIALKQKTEAEKKEYLFQYWSELDYYERFVFNKLITGSFRIGVSQKLMTRALSKATGIEEDILAYKLMGNWDPNRISFHDLVLQEKESDYLSKPYPFFLAYAVEDDVTDLGEVTQWSAEHKWDGIRSQTILRNDEIFVWSRGEELVTDKYPEFEAFVGVIPNGTVLDGELLPYPKGEIGTFKDLQTRIGRKNVSKSLLEKIPVKLKVYDILEWKGKDIRNKTYLERRKILESMISTTLNKQVTERWSLSEVEMSRNRTPYNELPILLSERMQFNSWEEVAKERKLSREKHSEGLVLKRNDSTYQVGRKKGGWWKWKVDPLTIDAVLTYAMRGHGRRSNLFTDYTFALWDKNEEGEKELVTFAKAYSGLTDKEFRQVDAWIKKNTLERFGPVRSVTPQYVFEIAFEGIAPSKRHKSGVATRFPRILKWRKDKKIDEANSLDDLKALIPSKAKGSHKK